MTHEIAHNDIDKDDKPYPFLIIMILPIILTVFLILVLFIITQDLRWIEAWLYIFSLAINLAIGTYFINKKNPRVLRNRSNLKKVGITKKTKSSAGSDKYILPILFIGIFGVYILSPFDHLYQWFQILPFSVEIIGLVISNIGIVIYNLAQIQNKFASKLLDINKGQKLVDTGLYGHIRHPLYTGVTLWVFGTPIALGSLISLIPAAVAFIAILLRIKFEEKMLIKGMNGYEDYRTRVKYKIIPKIY